MRLYCRGFSLTWLAIILLRGLADEVSGNARNLGNALNPIHEWRYIDYDYGSDARRRAAIESGEYNYTNAIPIDVDRWRNLTFVTVLRDRGVPSSLNVLSGRNGPGGPLLTPYPNWSWANVTNCSGIFSVYRVAIDRCDRLWVLDSGAIGTTHICPAQLLTFDLPTSSLLRRVTIPENVARNSSTGNGLLVTPVVQTFGRFCETTNVYIADANGHGLIVYDGNTFRRLNSRAFDFEPNATTYTIQGQSFQLQDGIVGMALSPRSQNLYFSPMSSFDLDFVKTWELKLLSNDRIMYRGVRNVLPTQSSAKAMSRSGVLFLGLVNDTSVGCWNEHSPLNRENIIIVARNTTTLQFTSGMKIKEHIAGEELLVLTNRFQRLATGTVNYNETNFRILRGGVRELVKHNRCGEFHRHPFMLFG